MIHCGKRACTVPFVGLSGIRPNVDLPAAFYSAVSILQLWSGFERDSTVGHGIELLMDDRSDAVCLQNNFDVTFLQNLGLTTVTPKHHISKLITTIFDATKPLPSAKWIYIQPQIGTEAAIALFLQIETRLSQFMDEVVASEESILTFKLNLLQGMRLASLMDGTGFIRDVAKIADHTERATALGDRFVQILAAVAFARYMKLVLGRVAELYVKTTSRAETKTMWTELVYLWNVGCSTLARPLVVRRSDVSTFTPRRLWRLPTAFSIHLHLDIFYFPKRLPPSS